MSRKHVQLGNSDSEFTLVIGDRSKASSEFGLQCISTIDELNDRIANLTKRRSKDTSHDSDSDDSDSDCESYDNNAEDRERAEEFKCMFGNNNNESVPRKSIIPSSKISTKKPLLVELHTFPGFSDENETPDLPSTLSPLVILKVITKAKKDLENKPTFRKVFKEFFLSIQSQEIMRDTFWWFFCHKYQSSPAQQEILFDKISKNYTNLLIIWTGSKYRDKLFKDYADLVSQAVYSTFCHAFPTSYRQFNAEFRDDILYLINLWMMGTKPAPRTWNKWNFQGIEPNGLRIGVTIKEDVKKFDEESQLEHIEKSPPSSSQRPRTRRLSWSESVTEFPSFRNRLNSEPFPERNLALTGMDGTISGTLSKRRNSTPPKLTQQLSTPPGDGRRGSLMNIMKQISSVNLLKKKREKKKSVDNIMLQISSVLGLVEKATTETSCAANGGPTFQKVVFNLHGRSPLVEHFLASHRLLKDAGTSVLVQRTEIEKLPPITAETYKDLIKNVKSNSRNMSKSFRERAQNQQKHYQDLMQSHKQEHLHFMECAEKLLSSSQDVRKLSELLKVSEAKEELEDAEKRSSKLRSLVLQISEGGDESSAI